MNAEESWIWRPHPQTKVCLKADGWRAEHVRWAKIAGSSPPPWKCLSRIVCEPAAYNVAHTCLASLCVTVYAGVWVRGPHCAKMDSFHPSPLEKELYPQGAPPEHPHHLWLHTCSAIHQVHLTGLSSFKSLPVCLFCHLFSASGRRNSSRWKQNFFTLMSLLKVFIFSAIWPQHFHSIVTPNKQPDCQSCRPAQPSLLPEVSLVENERLTGCFDIRALSVPLLISPNKRKPDHMQGRVSFSVWRKQSN